MGVLTQNWVLYGVVIILFAFFAAFLYMTRKFNYWSKRGVIHTKPIPFFGNFLDCTLFRKSVSGVVEDLYFEHKGHGHVGFYIYDKPCLLVRDLKLVKRILVKDFNTFANRYVSAGEHDPLGSANLFIIKNPHWKTLRTKLSPTMSSGKLKNMFQLMVNVANDLDTHLKSLNLEGEGRVVQFHEVWAKYTTDVIATTAYGLQANCLNNPAAEFRKYGKKVFEFTYKRAFEFGAIFFVPSLIKPFRLTFFEPSTTEFLRKAFWDTLTHRMKSGIRRNDLIDTLIELKKGQSQADLDDPNSFKFDGDNLTAQAAIYFTGGFETTSSTLSFCLYELALQPDIQSKLREEITSALDENEGELHYEWVTQLPYLGMVVSETLRKYPIVGILDRVAINDYEVPDSDLVIEKGTPIFISAAGFHHDPEYFPEPEKFDPERFNVETKQKIPPHVYMPFGDGPRNCIGLRFGLISVKIGLVKTISRYRFTPCKDTTIPLRINPMAVFTAMRDGLFLNVQEITQASRS